MTTIQEITDRISMLEERVESLEHISAQAGIESAKSIMTDKIRKDLRTQKAIVLERYVKGDLLKEMRQSLAVEFDIIFDGVNTIVMSKQGPTFVSVPVEPRKSRDPDSYHKGPRKPSRTHKGVYDGIRKAHAHKIMAELDAGKTLSTRQCAKLIDRHQVTANHVIKDYILKTGKYKVTKVGQGREWHLSLKLPGEETQPETKHHYMHKKSDYDKFRSQRIKWHMENDHLNYYDACALVRAEWKGKKQTGVQMKFPEFRTIQKNLTPILEGVLEKLFKSGTPIGFTGVSYALSIGKESEFRAFIEEILKNWDQLNAYFGTNVRPKWDGFELRLG